MSRWIVAAGLLLGICVAASDARAPGRPAAQGWDLFSAAALLDTLPEPGAPDGLAADGASRLVPRAPNVTPESATAVLLALGLATLALARTRLAS